MLHQTSPHAAAAAAAAPTNTGRRAASKGRAPAGRRCHAGKVGGTQQVRTGVAVFAGVGCHPIVGLDPVCRQGRTGQRRAQGSAQRRWRDVTCTQGQPAVLRSKQQAGPHPCRQRWCRILGGRPRAKGSRRRAGCREGRGVGWRHGMQAGGARALGRQQQHLAAKHGAWACVPSRGAEERCALCPRRHQRGAGSRPEGSTDATRQTHQGLQLTPVVSV